MGYATLSSLVLLVLFFFFFLQCILIHMLEFSANCQLNANGRELALFIHLSIVCFSVLFLLLGMDCGIPGGTSFTNLIEDIYNEYMFGSSHISGEDSIPQA